MSDRSWPVSTASLATFTHEGVEHDRCLAGHGVWLDKGELHDVVRSEAAGRPMAEELDQLATSRADAGAAVVADGERAARPCPVCGAAMRVVEYANSGIPVDECAHGTWLDSGELERIEAYAEGMRRITASGTTAPAEPVRGIALPADLLATISTAARPPGS
jgi:Zn-finger nucleic acid-binding protein